MEIKVATTMEELKEIAALRYDVYIRERGESQFFADRTTELLLEPVDAFNESTVVYIRESGTITATIRIEHRIPDWLLVQLGSVPGGFFNLKCCILSKTVTSATSRGTRLFDALSLWVGENIFAPNYELALMVCRSELIDLYTQYAWQSSQHKVKHPDGVGTWHLLAALACSDGVSGTRVRSLAGRFKYELSMERKAELYRWLKL